MTLKPTSMDLHHCFSYSPDIGSLVWKERGVGLAHRKGGRIAGTIRKDGYVHVQVGPKSYYAHCLIWCMVTGIWPEDQIDHKDLNRSNNKWDNLRAATPSQNKANIRALNRLGAKGVEVLPNGKFRARITKDGRDYHLGCFDSLDDAKAAYLDSAKQKFGEFARS